MGYYEPGWSIMSSRGSLTGWTDKESGVTGPHGAPSTQRSDRELGIVEHREPAWNVMSPRGSTGN